MNNVVDFSVLEACGEILTSNAFLQSHILEESNCASGAGSTLFLIRSALAIDETHCDIRRKQLNFSGLQQW